MTPFTLIVGPCVLEPGKTVHFQVAKVLADLAWKWKSLSVFFKASFQKANRTLSTSPRGPGLDPGLTMLHAVREETGLRVLTDVHEVAQVAATAEVCDALQIPAFLCRQTELLEAVGRTGRYINLKKGQWVGEPEMVGALGKLAFAKHLVTVTERGTFFGYSDLVVDFRNIPRLRTALRVPILYDGTHSLQRPGIGAALIDVQRYREPLILAAVAAGADGLFLEVHPHPASSPSDADTILPLDELEPLMTKVMAIRAARMQT